MLASRFHTYLRIEKQFSAHTLAAYRRDLEQLRAYLQAEVALDIYDPADIEQVSGRHLRLWLASQLEQGLSPRSLARKLSTCKRYFRFLHQGGELPANPVASLKLPRFEQKLPVFLKESETEHLFERVDFGDDFPGRRDRALLELLYGCGLRRSEIIGLRPENVDLYQRQLRIMGKGGKERLIPFGKAVAEAQQAYLELRQQLPAPDPEAFFLKSDGKRLYPKLVYRLVQTYLSVVSARTQLSPHVLRHTFATHLLDRGADLNAIKELLGHASLAATQVYTHNSISKLKSVHAQAHPRATNHKE